MGWSRPQLQKGWCCHLLLLRPEPKVVPGLDQFMVGQNPAPFLPSSCTTSVSWASKLPEILTPCPSSAFVLGVDRNNHNEPGHKSPGRMWGWKGHPAPRLGFQPLCKPLVLHHSNKHPHLTQNVLHKHPWLNYPFSYHWLLMWGAGTQLTKTHVLLNCTSRCPCEGGRR